MDAVRLSYLVDHLSQYFPSWEEQVPDPSEPERSVPKHPAPIASFAEFVSFALLLSLSSPIFFRPGQEPVRRVEGTGYKPWSSMHIVLLFAAEAQWPHANG